MYDVMKTESADQYENGVRRGRLYCVVELTAVASLTSISTFQRVYLFPAFVMVQSTESSKRNRTKGKA